jgi:O-antigen ligase
VLTAPLLFALIGPRAVGYGIGRRSAAAGIGLLLLMIVTARMTDNRMVWIALCAVFGVAALAAARRWPQALPRRGLRVLLPLAALLLVLGIAFNDALRERGESSNPPEPDIATTVEKDPRFKLWDLLGDKIGERMLLGYGFGRGIVASDLVGQSGNRTLTHAHNLFLAQWLQTGLIGMGAFVALLAGLVFRYWRFVRASDDLLAFAGIVGVSLIAGFVVKNLTDDFLFRSNAKEFWALTAMLLGFGVQREHALAAARAAAVDTAAHSE